MNDNPIVFAMANPDPEISYDVAVATRKDVIMATGRSDYPNQVNNVLGFPFIFRGALDVHAKAINEEMKKAAAYALAELAREDVPDSVKRAYNVENMSFGREYIIPKPFDPRVLTRVAPAVAKAAMDTGVARHPITNFDTYIQSLDVRMGRSFEIMHNIYQKAKQSPKKIVFPEGDNPKIISAAIMSYEMKIAYPILIGNENVIKEFAEEHGYDLSGIEIIDPKKFDKMDEYIEKFYEIRQRKGITKAAAKLTMYNETNYFGAMMVKVGDADGMVSGLTTHYPMTIRPALQVVGKKKDYSVVSGLYVVSTKTGTYFLSDTTVNIDPTGHHLSDITIQASNFVKHFDITPKVALLSYSNFGSAEGDVPEKMRQALKITKERAPELIIDGEMQADTAVVPNIINTTFPFSSLKGGANVLIFPNLAAGNIAYKLLNRIGGAHVLGPVLLGLDKPICVLQRGDDVAQILDMVAITVVDAQER
jgi:malate dehydrogenase (oxaloacetate-decarboxylating)(NADP+)